MAGAIPVRLLGARLWVYVGGDGIPYLTPMRDCHQDRALRTNSAGDMRIRWRRSSARRPAPRLENLPNCSNWPATGP
ncbi:MAG: hypothetical protein ACE5I1_07230 [bacterium]